MNKTSCELNCSSIPSCNSTQCHIATSSLVCDQCIDKYKFDPSHQCVIDCENITKNCSTCTNTSTCAGCYAPYYLNSSNLCSYNCSSIAYCTNCTVDDPNKMIICIACDTGFLLDNLSKTCQSVCGNGIVTNPPE